VTKRIAMLPEQDQATVAGNMHQKLGVGWTCSTGAVLTDILAEPNGHAHHNTALCSTGCEVIIWCVRIACVPRMFVY